MNNAEVQSRHSEKTEPEVPATLFPLSRGRSGTTVRIRRLEGSAEISQRLREIGFFEQQVIHLLAHQGSVICQIRNCRMSIGAKLAEAILVEAVG